MRISVINGVCVRKDAISEAVRGTVHALSSLGLCRLFCHACDFAEIDTVIVNNSTDILLNKWFLESDLIIYHYGIFYELFNCILIGNGKAKQVVRFHNVTPKELLSPDRSIEIDRSLRQIANIGNADRIWADSSYNACQLIEYGIDDGRIEVLPLYLKSNLRSVAGRPKPRDCVHILFDGRLVASKGVADLVEAVASAMQQLIVPIHVTLAGNIDFSDQAYIKMVKALIGKHGLSTTVHFAGQVDDSALAEIFGRSHIFVMPSYHEGFCVPLLEALHFGCFPIAYASGNVEDLIHSVGDLIAVGNKEELTKSLIRNVNAIGRAYNGDADVFLSLGDRALSLADFATVALERSELYSFAAFKDRTCRSARSLLDLIEDRR